MSFLDSALALARQGFYVFPLVPNGKTPLIKNFTEEATRDEEKIKDWWTCPVLDTEKDYNIGIATSKFALVDSLIVIDVDNKGEKKGDVELEKIQIFYDLPETIWQSTPTGGRHLIFKHKVPVKQGANVLGPGLDIRSKGGYIVGAGSVTENGKYLLSEQIAISDAPDWLIQACGQAPIKEERKAIEVNEDLAVNRAIEYLLSAPRALEGQSGDETTYKVAAAVKDFGVDEHTALELMSLHWNNECEPPWEYSALEEKVKNAYRYGNTPVGSKAPEADFDEVVTEIPEESLFYLQQMNKEYALVYMEGQHFILHETVDEKGKPKRVFLTEQTFKRRFSPYRRQQP